MKKYLIISAILFVTPVSLFATTFKTFIQNAINNVAYVSISLMIAVAVLAFFIGVIKFLYANSSGAEAGMTEGKQAMLWGIISILVLISVFGIVKLAQGLTGTGSVTDINMPALQDSMFGASSFQGLNSSQGGGK